MSETKALLAEQRAGCASACACRRVLHLARVARVLTSHRAPAEPPLRRRRNVLVARCAFRPAPASLRPWLTPTAPASQKGAQETAGKENSDGAAPPARHCRRACADTLPRQMLQSARLAAAAVVPRTRQALMPSRWCVSLLHLRKLASLSVPSRKQAQTLLLHTLRCAALWHTRSPQRAQLLTSAPCCCRLLTLLLCSPWSTWRATSLLRHVLLKQHRSRCARACSSLAMVVRGSHLIAAPCSAASPAVCSRGGATAKPASQVSCCSPCPAARNASGCCKSGKQPCFAEQRCAGRQPGASLCYGHRSVQL